MRTLLTLFALALSGAMCSQPHNTVVVSDVYGDVRVLDGTTERPLAMRDSLPPRAVLRLGVRSAVALRYGAIDGPIKIVGPRSEVQLGSVLEKHAPTVFESWMAMLYDGMHRYTGTAVEGGIQGVVEGKGGHDVRSAPMTFPADGERVDISEDGLRFEWRADSRMQYRFVLTDDVDDMSRWKEMVVRDTVLVVGHDRFRAEPSKPLYWTIVPVSEEDSAWFVEFIPAPPADLATAKSDYAKWSQGRRVHEEHPMLIEALYMESRGHFREAERLLALVPADRLRTPLAVGLIKHLDGLRQR